VTKLAGSVFNPRFRPSSPPGPNRSSVVLRASPQSLGQRPKIVEFLDAHGLIDLDSSTMFTAVFDAYTIEVEMPSPDRNGEIVVVRARP
jgi:hypothetical protein